MTDPVTILDEALAWTVLAGQQLGRLATVVDRHPEIYPVNFVVDGHDVVFRTASGSKLLSVAINELVAFEVDGWDATGGWSVLVRGQAEVVRAGADIEYLETLPLRPWVPTVKVNWVRLHVSEITGRRFAFGPEPSRDEQSDASD